MNEEFNNDQFERIYPDGIENHYWNHARNHIIYRCIKKAGLDREQIIEIGAGRGVVTKFLNNKGINITGVELAKVRPVQGMGDYFLPGTNAFELSLETSEKITVVLLLDVIEHIEEPAVFIKKILQHFTNLKYILITVPARQELWTNYDEFNGHYKRYNLRDIDALRADKSFIIFDSYFFHLLYPVFYFYSKWFMKRETIIKAPAGSTIVLHRLLSFLLQLDFLLFPEELPGTSIIALYKLRNDQRS